MEGEGERGREGVAACGMEFLACHSLPKAFTVISSDILMIST